ncbi:lipoprotein [Streptomyces mashuensis]|uniref:Lipoprotein n=1 Tax=Streptomyces mashuensis TaxID=33904 RepID=A0A919E8S6_9ACTN|nr:hypothetical protein [Streptomyces mashuensis]GHF29394.1 lipoprotein [Streptomyces mashuensis]
MRARRAVAAAALAGALAGVLAGCGVEPTDVVEVGRPAQGAKRPGAPVKEARLYFGYPGGLIPVSRPADAEVTAEEAVPLLLLGPNEPEKIRGLYSELPRMAGRTVVTTGEGTVLIQLPLDVTRLTPTARNQLVCTAAHNGVPGDLPPEEVRVTLSGGGRKVPDQLCDRRAGVPGQAAPTVSPAP